MSELATTEPEKHRRRCQAHTTAGDPCKNAPILGGNVCHKHGGSAPQVRRKATLRLLELVDPAIATLAREMVRAGKSADRQRAANSILDRAGWGRVTKVESEDAREVLLARLLKMREESSPTPENTDTGGNLP